MARRLWVRLVLLAATAAVVQGCATPPQLIPDGYSGPTAIIADTATGGTRGGTFFFVEEVNDERIVNSFGASIAASRGMGMNLSVTQVERKLIARKTKLKLVGRIGYAAPVQQMFKRDSGYAVDGLIEVDLKANTRYRVAGKLDAVTREVWLEEEGTQQVVGSKIVKAP